MTLGLVKSEPQGRRRSRQQRAAGPADQHGRGRWPSRYDDDGGGVQRLAERSCARVPTLVARRAQCRFQDTARKARKAPSRRQHRKKAKPNPLSSGAKIGLTPGECTLRAAAAAQQRRSVHGANPGGVAGMSQSGGAARLGAAAL